MIQLRKFSEDGFTFLVFLVKNPCFGIYIHDNIHSTNIMAIIYVYNNDMNLPGSESGYFLI